MTVLNHQITKNNKRLLHAICEAAFFHCAL